MTKIKICGLRRAEDIRIVNEAKPDYIGFVFAKSKRQVHFEEAFKLREMLSTEVIPVGVFVDEPINNVKKIIHSGIIEIVQLHGNESKEYMDELKSFSKIPIIKAVSVQKEGDVQRGNTASSDYLLLDHKGGGTGQSFNWDLIGYTTKPFFLAGGLHIDNVQEAIQKVNPFAIDVSSGVETDEYKDKDKIFEMIRRVRNE